MFRPADAQHCPDHQHRDDVMMRLVQLKTPVFDIGKHFALTARPPRRRTINMNGLNAAARPPTAIIERMLLPLLLMMPLSLPPLLPLVLWAVWISGMTTTDTIEVSTSVSQTIAEEACTHPLRRSKICTTPHTRAPTKMTKKDRNGKIICCGGGGGLGGGGSDCYCSCKMHRMNKPELIVNKQNFRNLNCFVFLRIRAVFGYSQKNEATSSYLTIS